MIIIKQFSAIARDPYVTKEEESITEEQLQAKSLAAEFYSDQNLTVLVRYLIMDYLQLGQRELEAWESAPEEYIRYAFVIIIKFLKCSFTICLVKNNKRYGSMTLGRVAKFYFFHWSITTNRLLSQFLSA